MGCGSVVRRSPAGSNGADTALFPWPQSINPAGGPYLPSELEGGRRGWEGERGGEDGWGLEPSSSPQGQQSDWDFPF